VKTFSKSMHIYAVYDFIAPSRYAVMFQALYLRNGCVDLHVLDRWKAYWRQFYSAQRINKLPANDSHCDSTVAMTLALFVITLTSTLLNVTLQCPVGVA